MFGPGPGDECKVTSAVKSLRQRHCGRQEGGLAQAGQAKANGFDIRKSLERCDSRAESQRIR